MNFKSLKFIFPFLKNSTDEVKDPDVAENLLVPSARWGGNPTNMYAGIEIKPPPPAMESTNPAIKQAITKNIKLKEKI